MAEAEFLASTRAAYDAVASGYAGHFRDEPDPLGRAMLAAFAELVLAAGAGPVADVGCGTGRVTAYLSTLGVPVSGIDLSPGMIAAARQAYPELRFEVGSMLALDRPDGTLGGILAWYSVIHIPTGLLPAVFAEFHRVLAPGGYLQLGFAVGDEPLHVTEAMGQPVCLVFHRQQPGHIGGLLTAAGLPVRAELIRSPDTDGPFPEKSPQAFLLARKPARHPAAPGWLSPG